MVAFYLDHDKDDDWDRVVLLIRLLIVTTVCLWGWSFVATKICLAYLSPAEVIGARYLLGLPVLFIVVLAKRVSWSMTRRDLMPILLSGLVIAVHFAIQVTGMTQTSATNTGWLIAVTPAALVVLSVLFLKEKITRSILLGVTLATIGIVLLVSKGRIGGLEWVSSVGDWLVLASAFTWAIYTVISRNVSRRKDPLMVSFLILASSSVILVSWMAATGDWHRFASLPLEPLLALLFLGLICHGLAFWFWQIGVARLGAARTGIFLYLEPLATTGLAVPYLGEEFGWYTAVGGMLMLAGVFISQQRRKA